MRFHSTAALLISITFTTSAITSAHTTRDDSAVSAFVAANNNTVVVLEELWESGLQAMAMLNAVNTRIASLEQMLSNTVTTRSTMLAAPTQTHMFPTATVTTTMPSPATPPMVPTVKHLQDGTPALTIVQVPDPFTQAAPACTPTPSPPNSRAGYNLTLAMVPSPTQIPVVLMIARTEVHVGPAQWAGNVTAQFRALLNPTPSAQLVLHNLNVRCVGK